MDEFVSTFDNLFHLEGKVCLLNALFVLILMHSILTRMKKKL